MTQELTQTEVVPSRMKDKQIAHLAGVFDIAGTINVYISEDTDFSLGYKIQPTCRLSYPKKNENPLMGKVVAYCEDAGVKYSFFEVSHGTDKTGKSERVEITNLQDINRFLEPMMPYLVANHEIAVIMLGEVIPRMEDKIHHDVAGFIEVMKYADAIRKRSQHDSRLKYDKTYFEELLLAE